MWPFTRRHKAFGEILIEKGLASKKDIDEAIRVQNELKALKRGQKKIGEILQERGVIDIVDVESTLEEQKRDQEFILKTLIYAVFNIRQIR